MTTMQSNFNVRSLPAAIVLAISAVAPFSADAQTRRATYRDQDWRSASGGANPRSDLRTADRGFDDRRFDDRRDRDRRYDEPDYRDRRYDDGVRPDAPIEDRYDARDPMRREVDRRYDRAPDYRSDNRTDDRVDYRRGTAYRDPYEPARDPAGWRPATPWQPVGEARPVDSWRPVDARRTAMQLSPADGRPSLGGPTGSFVQPLDGVQPGYLGRGMAADYGCNQGGYYGARGLGYNNVPLNAPLNNSFPTTQVSPINNIQPLPGYGGSGMLPGQQYFGRNDFNDNGWNWGSNRSVPWRPLIPIKAPPSNYVVGQGLWGQPKVYVPQQPVRNFIRYLFP